MNRNSIACCCFYDLQQHQSTNKQSNLSSVIENDMSTSKEMLWFHIFVKYIIIRNQKYFV